MENTEAKIKELYDSLDDNHKFIVDNHLEGFDWDVYEREIDLLNEGTTALCSIHIFVYTNWIKDKKI